MLVPDKYTFIFVLINLIVLYLFMRKLLFKPVTEFMEKRKNGIEQSLKEAEEAKLLAAKTQKSYEEKIKSTKEEAEKILNEAKVRAVHEAEEIIKNAQQEALEITKRGREEVERERAEMLGQIKQQIALLAIAAATQVVQTNMDTAANRVIVEKFIDEAGAA